MNKQYLLMVDESALGLIKQCFMGLNIEFLEVQGMPMQTGIGSVLMTPNRPPVPVPDMPAQPLAPPSVQTDVPVPDEQVV